jgi:hypothetical protein
MGRPDPSVPIFFPVVTSNYWRERAPDGREMTVDRSDMPS